VYRKDAKDKPYVYRNERFTEQLLEDFLRIIPSLKLFDANLLYKHIEEASKLHDSGAFNKYTA
jgi:hypothetical protein